MYLIIAFRTNGMIKSKASDTQTDSTCQQNLDNLLAAGSISQDEYNQYYPYDRWETITIRGCHSGLYCQYAYAGDGSGVLH